MRHLILTAILFCLSGTLTGQVTLINPQTDQKLLKDFQNRKLGLFVHWMACHTPETGDSWSIGNGTSKQVADSITLAWNPVNFNPKEIVDFAVKAGCKYIVVISKHHDGFAIWNSQFSNWDLERIKFKRDILKELESEAHKRGLLFGIYYSIADIHYAGWKSMPAAPNPPATPKGGKEAFVQFVHNQVKELIKNYKPDILWFDGHWLDPLWGPKEGKELYNLVKSLKPSTLSTRLSVTRAAGGVRGTETFIADGSSGDFFSYEAKTQNAPAFPWEACTSVSYPVYAYEPKAKMHTKEELVNTFSKVLCGNGNFLLNIGPERTGELPKQLTDRFLEFSDWVNQYKDAVYNTSAGPFKQGAWGGSTYKDNKIYLHLRNPAASIKITSQQLKGYKPESVVDLKTGKPLKLEKLDDGYLINTSSVGESGLIPVIAIKLNRKYIFTKWEDQLAAI
ncbi:alpha-L-fucosidase [Pedobacter frigoris]|uniref:alpha-L-fucosidase n=1 Tax=Pedobacter frigoris TaxID=2571272 RepID=UPI002930572E|nr:alpha-L-fucosidase [Pedobacter frigoris]